MDEYDKILIDTLKKHGEMNKQTLWRKSFCREGQRAYTRRLDRMNEEGTIDISIKIINKRDRYIINLGEKNGRK